MMFKRKEQDLVVEKLRSGMNTPRSANNNSPPHATTTTTSTAAISNNEVIIDSLQQQQTGNLLATATNSSSSQFVNNNNSAMTGTTLQQQQHRQPPQTAPSLTSTTNNNTTHNNNNNSTIRSRQLVSSNALRRGDPLMNHFVALPTSNHESMVNLFTQAEVPEEAERLQKIMVPGELFAAAEFRAEKSEEKFQEVFAKLQQSELQQMSFREKIIALEAEVSRLEQQSISIKDQNARLLEIEKKDKDRIRELIERIDNMRHKQEETEKQLHDAEKYVVELQQKNVSVMAKSARLKADVEFANESVRGGAASMLLSVGGGRSGNRSLNSAAQMMSLMKKSLQEGFTRKTNNTKVKGENKNHENNEEHDEQEEEEEDDEFEVVKVNDFKSLLQSLKEMRMTPAASARQQRSTRLIAADEDTQQQQQQQSQRQEEKEPSDVSKKEESSNVIDEMKHEQQQQQQETTTTTATTSTPPAKQPSTIDVFSISVPNIAVTGEAESVRGAQQHAQEEELQSQELPTFTASNIHADDDESEKNEKNQEIKEKDLERKKRTEDVPKRTSISDFNEKHALPSDFDPLLLVEAASEFEEKYKQKCREIAQFRIRMFARDATSSRHILALRQVVDDSQQELASYKRRFVRALGKDGMLSASTGGAFSNSQMLSVRGSLRVPVSPTATNNNNNNTDDPMINRALASIRGSSNEKEIEEETERLPTPPLSWGEQQVQKEMKSLLSGVDSSSTTHTGASGNVLQELSALPTSSPKSKQQKTNKKCTSERCQLRKRILIDQLALLEQDSMFRFDFDANRGPSQKQRIQLRALAASQQQLGNSQNPSTTTNREQTISPTSNFFSSSPPPPPGSDSRASTRMAGSFRPPATNDNSMTSGSFERQVTKNPQEVGNNNSSSGPSIDVSRVEDASINLTDHPEVAMARSSRENDETMMMNNTTQNNKSSLSATQVLRSSFEKSQLGGSEYTYKKQSSLGEMLDHLEEASKYILLLGSESMPEAHNAGRILHSNRMLYAASTAIVDGAASFLTGAETAVTALTALENAVFGSKSLQEARIKWAKAREDAQWVHALGTHVDSGSIALRDSLVELRCYAKKKYFGEGASGGMEADGYLKKSQSYREARKPAFLMTVEEKLAYRKAKKEKKMKQKKERRLKQLQKKQIRSLGGGGVGGEDDYDDDDDLDDDDDIYNSDHDSLLGSISSINTSDISISSTDDDDDNFTTSQQSNAQESDEEEAALDFKTFKLAHNIHNVIREFELEFLRQKSGGVATRPEFRSYVGAHHASENLFSAANREQALVKNSKVYDNTPEGIYKLMHDTAGKLRLIIPLLVNFVKSFPRWDQIALDGSDELQKLIKYHQEQQQKQFGVASVAAQTSLNKKILEQQREAEKAEIFRQEVLARAHPRWKLLLDRLMTFTKKIDARKLKNKESASSWRLDKQRQRRERKEKERIAKQAIKLMEDTQGMAMIMDETTGELVPVDKDGNPLPAASPNASPLHNNLNPKVISNHGDRTVASHYRPHTFAKNLPPVVARLYPNYRPKYEFNENDRRSSSLQQHGGSGDESGGDHHHRRTTSNLHLDRQTSFYKTPPRRFQHKETGPQAAMERWLARRKQVLGGYHYSNTGTRKAAQQHQEEEQHHPQNNTIINTNNDDDQYFSPPKRTLSLQQLVSDSGSPYQHQQQIPHQHHLNKSPFSSAPPRSISPSAMTMTPRSRHHQGSPSNFVLDRQEHNRTAVFRSPASGNDSNTITPGQSSGAVTPSQQQQHRRGSALQNRQLVQENEHLHQQVAKLQSLLHEKNPLNRVASTLTTSSADPSASTTSHPNNNINNNNRQQQQQKIVFTIEDIETANPDAIRALITKAGGVGEVSKVLRNSLRDEQVKTDKLQREVIQLRKLVDDKANSLRASRDENQAAKIRGQLSEEQEANDRLKKEVQQNREELAHLRYQLEKANKQLNRGTFGKVKSFTLGSSPTGNATSSTSENVSPIQQNNNNTLEDVAPYFNENSNIASATTNFNSDMTITLNNNNQNQQQQQSQPNVLLRTYSTGMNPQQQQQQRVGGGDRTNNSSTVGSRQASFFETFSITKVGGGNINSSEFVPQPPQTARVPGRNTNNANNNRNTTTAETGRRHGGGGLPPSPRQNVWADRYRQQSKKM